MAAFDSFIAAGVDLGFFGRVGNDGYMASGGGATPANGNAAGSAATRVRGLTNADPSVPAADVVNIPGDNTSMGSFGFSSEANVAFNVDKSVFNLLHDAIMQRTTTHDEGNIRMGILKPTKNDPEDIFWILQGPSKKYDPGVRGVKAWTGFFVPISNVYPGGRQAYATRAAASDRYRVITTPADMLFSGLLLDDTNFDTDGGNVVPFTNDYPIYAQTWRGDGTEDTFTMAYAPAEYNDDQIVIRVNGTLMAYTSGFTASGVTIVFAAPPAAGAKIVALIGSNELAA